MKNKVFRIAFFMMTIAIIVWNFFAHATPVFAQTMVKPTYHRGHITQILREEVVAKEAGETEPFYIQLLQVKLSDGQTVEVQSGSEFQPLNENQRLKKGTAVVLAYQETTVGHFEYVLADVYRLPVLIWLLIGFLALVLIVARLQGLFAIVGMVLSLGVLMTFILPQILAGQNPVAVSLVGCGVVAVVTVYLCHGFKTQSHIALASMFGTLTLVGALSLMAVHLGYLVGLGSEEAYYLQFGVTAKLNLQGLLLGGIMLGTLGVLDDIAVAQVSLVNQLRDAKPDITFPELYQRSLAVGKDHVASLVNTLVLAYAGGSLPLFLLFTLNEFQPPWVSLNMEIIAEEVVRTLIGSIGLVFAVPLTTLLASYFALRRPAETHSKKHHTHRH